MNQLAFKARMFYPSGMHPAEKILLEIGAYLALGKNCREAVAAAGGEEQVEAAMIDGMKAGTVSTARRLLAVLSVCTRMDQDDADIEQALELSSAGWEAITPPAKSTEPKNIWDIAPVMSWQWRRPSKRPGKPGRKFLSTNQAWMAMKRELTIQP